jgi:hypothetical protein
MLLALVSLMTRRRSPFARLCPRQTKARSVARVSQRSSRSRDERPVSVRVPQYTNPADMTRRLLNLLTLLSLLLCVAVLALWPCSYFAIDAVAFWPSPAQRRAYGLLSQQGSFCFLSVAEGSGGRPFAWRHDRTRQRSALVGGVGGFVFKPDPTLLVIGMPHWMLGLLLAIPPALWLRRRGTHRPIPGLCPACGYDLRATPDRCPECGECPPRYQRDETPRAQSAAVASTSVKPPPSARHCKGVTNLA